MIQQQRQLNNSNKPGASRSLSKLFVQVADQFTVQQWMDIAVLFRILILLCMALSCYLCPKHLLAIIQNDDSVATFPLRLLHTESTLSDDILRPFALPNSICTSLLQYQLVVDVRTGFSFKLQENNNKSAVTMPSHSSHIWSFLLTPLTRWDAARFLQLAHEPDTRYPQLQYHWQADTFGNEASPIMDGSTISQIKNITNLPSCPNVDQILQQSQEAHAFLPLYPLLIQIVVGILLWCSPTSKLPSTCEGVVVLAAYLLNTICYLWSAKQLYNMTKLLLDRNHISSNNESERWARRVLLLYIINPATVFFNTTYSESCAAAFIFTGYYWILYYRTVAPSVSYLVGTWLVWYLSCFIRSNGTLTAGFLFLFGIGSILGNSKTLPRLLLVSISAIVGPLALVIGSLGVYNYHAYRNHCRIGSIVLAAGNDSTSDESIAQNHCSLLDGYQAPEWCQYGPYFNVYSFVQRKYWNVGLFRYYEWKQLPNFILAAPVLYCSMLAVLSWIKISWERYSQLNDTTEKCGLKFVQKIFGWSITSLQLFANDRAYSTGMVANEPTAIETALLGDPILLGHYAVLAVSVLIGISLAHVQITTRMIFSSCPALYWYLVVIISKNGRYGDAVVFWCFLYIILGLIMHPNWLPWT